jgi:hypothetical protein
MPETVVARFLLKWLLVPLVLLWGYHLAQRRFAGTTGAKRMASMYLTVLLVAAWVAVYAFVQLGVPDIWLPAVAVAAAGVAAWQRKAMLPYRLRCANCSKPLGLLRILFRGDNTCATCSPDDKETLP